MLIISTISEASFCHVQGTTSRDLWLSLEKAYEPHSTSREYTLKTQLLRIKMHVDETPDAYLNHAQEYVDALAAIGEPVKDKDLVMLVVSGLREEYNGLKTTITARQSPTAFNELHALLSDHDYMLGKTRTPIAPYGPQAFYGARPSNNNRSNNNNNHGNCSNSRGNNNRAQKSDVYSTFKSFMQMVERQFTTKLKNVQTDWGGEFQNLASFFSSLGIIHRRSCPHTSEQNGFVERRNRHVVETGLTLLAQACVPQHSGHYAFETVVYLINHMPSRTSTNKSPFEHIFKRSPEYYFPSVFGCLCFPHLRPYNRHKMDFRSTPCVFLGYSPSHHGYRCLDISTERLYIARHWRQAMKEEYDALMKNGTWSLVPRASNTNVVDGKWVYRLKRDKNGAITRYKARFVAKGFRQQPGIDFHETFSPVVKSTTIRAVLSLAVTNDWPLRQLDIQNAFLHGNLKEQAPRAWFERLSKALFDLGFKGSKTDPSLFIYSRGDTLLYILVYVDDIIVTGNNKGTIDNIICQLGSAFALKDLGPLNYFLGIEIVPHVSGILLSQKKYILELLQSAGLSNCNPVSSPMVILSSLSLDDNTAFSNPVKYRQVVGSLQYVTLSRPDIAFAVNKVIPILLLKLSEMLTGLEIQMIDEVEYKALADTVAELTWLQALLNELGIRSSSTPILCRDPISMEPFWMQHAADSAVVISGWHRMSYKYADHTTMSTELEKYIRKMHSIVGNAITEGRYLVFGIRSSQLLNAAVYALSSKNSSTPSNVFASIPFYPTNNMDVVEFVTSPNNPDGELKTSVLEGKTIYDHAYFWPHFTPIPGPSDHDLMIFTLSKLTGHAAVEGDGKPIFEFSYNKLRDRWERLTSVFLKSTRFSIQQRHPSHCNFFNETRLPSPAYVWVKFERVEENDCGAVLEAGNIKGRSGSIFSSKDCYVRLSLIKSQDDFELLLQRLTEQVSLEKSGVETM
ncbi:tryptophan aminotransferase-related protein 3-like protein [Tanacetum coccineum]